MAVVFSFIFGRFALVFTAFCLYVAVPLVRFSTFFSFLFNRFIYSGCVFWGELGGGGCNNVLSLAFYLTALFGATL